MFADFFHPRRGCRAFFVLWRWNLEEPRATEILGKSEGVLVLHHRFRDACQTFRFKSAFKVNAGLVKC